MVDTSPSVIITPTTFFHHIQHAEEYRQAPAVGSFLRWVRTIGIATSLFIIPFWLLLVIEPTLLPAALDFIGPEETNNIPIQFAGAGTLIPVTGFMNAMTSAALEYKSEGLVYSKPEQTRNLGVVSEKRSSKPEQTRNLGVAC